jgi:tRNA A-37 threonylcarbamoyl transferase component Bud32
VSDPGARLGEIVGGKYRVQRFIAAGGMGVVYEAQHLFLGRRFAIKFLRPELVNKRESLARFQREAQAAGALESDNVAAVLDFGIVPDGSPYLVMEYLLGENLERLLAREGPLPLERASELVLQASRGVQCAHAAGIVHRDLKPQNLFTSRREDGTELVKVLDFGVAKLGTFDDANSATRTGSVLGTPAYMSPEQARGEKNIDHRADVYALGAILYELVSGQRPHPGDSPNAVLHHIATQPPVPLSAARPELPSALLDVVARALAAEPDQRFSSVEGFAQALAPFARRTVWPAPPIDLPGARAEASGVARFPRFWAFAISAVVVAGVGMSVRGRAPVSPSRGVSAAIKAAGSLGSLPAPIVPAPVTTMPSAARPPAATAITSVPPSASATATAAPRPPRSAVARRQPARGAAAGSAGAHSGMVTFDSHNPYN